MLFSSNRIECEHGILVPGSTRPTFQQALDEFWWYDQNRNYLTADENFIETYYSNPTCGCTIQIDWPLPMLAFKRYNAIPAHGWGAVSWTGSQVESYSIMYRVEKDINRKYIYEERAKKGGEFLLWSMQYFKEYYNLGVEGAYYWRGLV